MIHRFESFELDTDRYELRRDGQRRPIEPQVFALLQMLVENRHRMVPREEIIATIWAGRTVSDSALSSRVKSARQALDDDGLAQRLIRTVHGQGFRFVGRSDVRRGAGARSSGADGGPATDPGRAGAARDRRAPLRKRERPGGGRVLRRRHRRGADRRAVVVAVVPDPLPRLLLRPQPRGPPGVGARGRDRRPLRGDGPAAARRRIVAADGGASRHRQRHAAVVRALLAAERPSSPSCSRRLPPRSSGASRPS